MKIAVNLSNPFILIYFIGTILTFVINQVLKFVDFKFRKKNGGNLPKELADIPLAVETFDTQKLSKISDYENAKYYLGLFSSISTFILDFCLILFGFYPWIFTTISSWVGFPETVGNTFLSFGLFLILSSLPGEVLALPFSLYREFHTEKKFGFSKMTFKLWILDQIKELLVGLVIGSVLLILASLFLVKCPNNWWWILAAVMISFTFIMQVIYPKFIAPLFNKFEPLPEGELKEKITEIINKTGFKNGGLYVMDASKRSGHSNAYFSGFGKSKRIVLYDSLINSMSADELTTVLGHELGHFKLHHITKRLFIMIPMEFLMMLALYILAKFPLLYNGFGFQINAENITNVQFIGLFLAAALYGSVSEIFKPLGNIFSRKNEYEADAFAAKICGTGNNLITALIKLNSENLSEILPSNLYVFWNYSHPSLCQRISALRKIEKNQNLQ